MFTISGFADEISTKLDEQIAEVKNLGIKHLELRSIFEKNVSEFTDAEAMGFKKAFDGNGLKVSAIGSPIGKIKVTDPFEPHLEKFARVLRMAEIFETPLIRLFSFYLPDNESHAQHRPEVLRRMAALRERATAAGRVICLENEARIYGEAPKHCLDLLQSLEHPDFRMAFDFANFTLEGHDTHEAWKSLGPYTRYFHIKDAFHKPWRIVPAGEGDSDLPGILSQAMAAGFSGYCSLEPHLHEFDRGGGFSGLSNFALAHRALVKVFQKIGADYA
jgi:3-dehydroshikimate dehydratase